MIRTNQRIVVVLIISLTYRGQNAFAEQGVDDCALSVAGPAEEDDLHVIAAQHAADTLHLFAVAFDLE